MKANKLDFAPNAAFDLSAWRPAVRVSLRAYMKFNFHMDEQLEKLVAQWSHTASPGRSRGRRRRIR